MVSPEIWLCLPPQHVSLLAPSLLAKPRRYLPTCPGHPPQSRAATSEPPNTAPPAPAPAPGTARPPPLPVLRAAASWDHPARGARAAPGSKALPTAMEDAALISPIFFWTQTASKLICNFSHQRPEFTGRVCTLALVLWKAQAQPGNTARLGAKRGRACC